MEVIVANNCKKVNKLSVMNLEATLGSDFKKGVLDSRHNVFSIGVVQGHEMYFNYLEILRECAHESTCGRYFGILDIGFIPLFMPPSFMNYDMFASEITNVLDMEGLKYYKLPASSFSKPQYTDDYPDIWVNKMDYAKFVGKSAEQVRVEDILRKVGW